MTESSKDYGFHSGNDDNQINHSLVWKQKHINQGTYDLTLIHRIYLGVRAYTQPYKLRIHARIGNAICWPLSLIESEELECLNVFIGTNCASPAQRQEFSSLKQQQRQLNAQPSRECFFFSK